MTEVALSQLKVVHPEPLNTAIDSLKAQSKALTQIAQRLGSEFVAAIELILSCPGRTIVSGIGKSGLVGKKIAATLASTGTPSFFIHPTEAYHGDLGMITPDDLVILISYSGETEEVNKLVSPLRNFGNRIISILGNNHSTLARNSDVCLNVTVEREICPNNLAPTTSTLATMAMGDAIAVALIKARDFKPMDFARYHPGGSLGRRLHTRVRDVMRHRNLPFISPEKTVHESMFTMTTGRLGLAIVVEDDLLKGIITDGDLRRAMLRDPNMMNKPVCEFMTKDPVTVQASTLLVDAENLMQEKKISALIVMGDRSEPRKANDICGVLEIYDHKPTDSLLNYG